MLNKFFKRKKILSDPLPTNTTIPIEKDVPFKKIIYYSTDKERYIVTNIRDVSNMKTNRNSILENINIDNYDFFDDIFEEYVKSDKHYKIKKYSPEIQYEKITEYDSTSYIDDDVYSMISYEE